MSRYLRLAGFTFVGLLFAVALALFSGGGQAYAQSNGCDTSGTHDGTASPTLVLPGQQVSFTATGFQGGENVSFWFTRPDGAVAGTASPLCCASGDGSVRFAPLTLPGSFYQYEGRWALTVQGAASNHQSVIYFCVFQTQPTVAPSATPVPPTATAVPPTATTAPATATTAPAATDTPVATAPAATETPVATAPAATATTVVENTPTAAVPTATTAPVSTPVPQPTEAASPVATQVPGMPRTGSGDSLGAVTLVALLLAAGLLSAGFYSRRRTNPLD
jgi:hypothetical protein